MRYEILHGDCLDVMQLCLDDNSVDAIVTDPPYGLGFMGKHWDHGTPGVEFWAEMLRILKPGGHLLAFAGTRTQHRMACAIEDAGFEIRDMIAWVYGSGFPKSMDVSKAIDKAGGDALAWRAFSKAYELAVKASSLTHSDIDRALGIKSSSCYWARTDHRGGMPPRHHWEKVRDLLALPAEFARLYDEAEREVIGEREMRDTSEVRLAVSADAGGYDASARRVVGITAPATDTAHQWQGWGTALKPALEPITVARKPLIGTVAENVLAHGTGALNIDGCRVETTDDLNGGAYSNGAKDLGKATSYATGVNAGAFKQPTGRWPANLIHDGSDEVVALFPSAPGQLARARTDGVAQANAVYGSLNHITANPEPRGDAGSAARFFYCAKASRKDRNEGCGSMEKKPLNWSSGTQNPGSFQSEGTDKSAHNHHPTVKPTDLMRYLCRLVTPPGGIILDPFMGSGSTGKAAVLEGFQFIGIEREAEYVEIAEARIQKAGKSELIGGE